MKNKFLNFKSLMLIITLAFTINFLNISANADSDIPDPSELLYVTDNANILSDETKNYLVKQNETLYEATGAQIAILTIDAIPNGYDSETYSYTVLDHWGVGSSEKNNGVVILLVPGEGKFWIAQGAGLDKTLSSYVLNKIIDNDLANDFDNGNYDKAVTNTFNSIVKLINKSYSPTEDKDKNKDNANSKNDLNTSKKSSGDSLIPQRSQLIWVTDNADVLPDSSINYIITKNEKFAETNDAEISVLTIENLPEGNDIETYAYKVFDEWDMDLKEKNNGVLLLIVSGENKTFIATGSGLKSALTTSTTYKSIEKNFATSLSTHDNKYNISNVVSNLATKINTIDKNNSYNTSTTENNSDNSDVPYIGYLFIILSFILFFWYFSKHASKSSSKNTYREKNYDSNSSNHNYTNNSSHSFFSSKRDPNYKYDDDMNRNDDRYRQNKRSFRNDNNRYDHPKKSFWGSSSTSSRSSNSSSSSTKNKPPKKSSFGGGKSSPPKKNSFGGGKSSFFGSSSSSKNSSSGSSSFGGGSSRGGGAGRK
jgi:uncharacterized protein